MIKFLLGVLVGAGVVWFCRDFLEDLYDEVAEYVRAGVMILGVLTVLGLAGLVFGLWHL